MAAPGKSTLKAGPIGLIAAISKDRVIGIDGKIPWHHPADLKRFKRVTSGTTVIMGRKTWESMNSRPLPNRRNIVVTTRPLSAVEWFPTITEALAHVSGPVWFIGGAGIYAEAILFADVLDITHVPDEVPTRGAVLFPEIDDAVWNATERAPLEGDPTCDHVVYRRRSA